MLRATNQLPETMPLGNYGVPLIGFGFAANNAYLAKNSGVVAKFLTATKKGFVEAARDYKAACELMQAKVHLAGTIERCVDYNKGVLALSNSPTDPTWGQQSSEEWTKLLATLSQDAGELFGDKPLTTYCTNDFVPKWSAFRRHRRRRRSQRSGRGGVPRPRRAEETLVIEANPQLGGPAATLEFMPGSFTTIANSASWLTRAQDRQRPRT